MLCYLHFGWQSIDYACTTILSKQSHCVAQTAWTLTFLKAIFNCSVLVSFYFILNIFIQWQHKNNNDKNSEKEK